MQADYVAVCGLRIDFTSITSNPEENIIAQRLGFHSSGDLMEFSTRKCPLCMRCFSYKNGHTQKKMENIVDDMLFRTIERIALSHFYKQTFF